MTAGASHSDEYLNLATDVPQEAMDLWSRKPDVREEYDTVDASDYDGRSGDLSELIEDASAQGAIVDLGSGTYEMESTVTGSDSIVGVVGDGSEDATIYYRGTDLTRLFDVSIATGVFEGVTFDITETTADGHDTDVTLLNGQFSNEFWAEDVVLRGRRHRWQDLDGDGDYETVGGRMTFLVEMTAADAEGFVHKCSFPDGGTPMLEERIEANDDWSKDDPNDQKRAHTGHAIGPNADPNHDGLTVWKDVYASGFVDNCFYFSSGDPVGQNVLWNCYSANNGAGNMRVGWSDEIVGGATQVYDLSEDSVLEGRATALINDHDDAHVVGLECIGEGDAYGSGIINGRGSADNFTLDRVTLHAMGDGRAVRFSNGDDRIQVDISDCYWYDEGPAAYRGQATVQIRGTADVTSDADWRVFSENTVEVRVMDGGTLVHDGQSRGEGTHSADELGMEDPRPLPRFYFDYGHETADFTVDRGIYGADGASTDRYRYNVTEIQSVVSSAGYGATATFEPDHRGGDVTSYQGIQVTPEMPLDGFRVQIDPDSSGITHATIRNTNGDVLAEEDVSGLNPGDYVDINYALDAGTTYWVLLGNHGDLYTRGSSHAKYPIKSGN